MDTKITVTFNDGYVCASYPIDHYYEQDGWLHITEKSSSDDHEKVTVTNVNLDKVNYYKISTVTKKEETNNG